MTSGLLAATTAWQTTTACPAGYQGSDELWEWTVGGSPGQVSPIGSAPAVDLANSTGFSGPLRATPGQLLNEAGINASNPGEVEWVVGCYAGPIANGPVKWEQSLFISVAAGATNFTTSSTGPAVAPTVTTLAASPNPVSVNGTVTLTATVTSGSAFPAGTVQFAANGTDIFGAVNVNTGNISAPAQLTWSFPEGGVEALSAVFVPTNTVSYSGSTGTFSLAVGAQLAGGTNPVPVSVPVPPTGVLSVTVATGSVTLTPASPPTTPYETATGTMSNVTISDTRNTVPGWSVTGQESDFTGPGTSTIPASSLGWTPQFASGFAFGVDGAQLGPTVAPAGGTGIFGLSTAATLASAVAGYGFGTNVINANLLLVIPPTTPPGAYAGTLTITYVTVGP